jgi:membrane protease YdiL (CAAX protease family)
MTTRRRLQSIALLGFLVGIVFSAYRVRMHAESELRHVSEPVKLGAISAREGATDISSRLTAAALREGETATFELCADDAMQAEPWSGAFLVLVWAPATETLGLKIPMDGRQLALVRRRDGRACMPLGGGPIPVSDRYAIDLVHRYQPIPKELAEVSVWGRILARRPLGPLDALGFALVFVSILLLLSTFIEPGARTPALNRSEAWRIGLPGIAVGVAGIYLVFSLPSAGPLAVMGRGLLVGLVQVGVSIGIARAFAGGPRIALALYAPPKNVWPAIVFSVASGAGTYGIARVLLHLVPSTGEAPITGFVAWSSGALSFATLGLLTPVAEEVFFRGFVFKTLEAFGKAAAILGSALAFALLHLEQTYGNWGAFSSIAVAGLVFSGLRAATGSTLVPAFAHLFYNSMLSLSAFE